MRRSLGCFLVIAASLHGANAFAQSPENSASHLLARLFRASTSLASETPAADEIPMHFEIEWRLEDDGQDDQPTFRTICDGTTREVMVLTGDGLPYAYFNNEGAFVVDVTDHSELVFLPGVTCQIGYGDPDHSPYMSVSGKLPARIELDLDRFGSSVLAADLPFTFSEENRSFTAASPRGSVVTIYQGAPRSGAPYVNQFSVLDDQGDGFVISGIRRDRAYEPNFAAAKDNLRKTFGDQIVERSPSKELLESLFPVTDAKRLARRFQDEATRAAGEKWLRSAWITGEQWRESLENLLADSGAAVMSEEAVEDLCKHLLAIVYQEAVIQRRPGALGFLPQYDVRRARQLMHGIYGVSLSRRIEQTLISAVASNELSLPIRLKAADYLGIVGLEQPAVSLRNLHESINVESLHAMLCSVSVRSRVATDADIAPLRSAARNATLEPAVRVASLEALSIAQAANGCADLYEELFEPAKSTDWYQGRLLVAAACCEEGRGFLTSVLAKQYSDVAEDMILDVLELRHAQSDPTDAALIEFCEGEALDESKSVLIRCIAARIALHSDQQRPFPAQFIRQAMREGNEWLIAFAIQDYWIARGNVHEYASDLTEAFPRFAPRLKILVLIAISVSVPDALPDEGRQAVREFLAVASEDSERAVSVAARVTAAKLSIPLTK
jgi:hypothetical protein